MLTTIYNAPTTIDTYYDALVRHDMSHGYLEGGFKKLKMKQMCIRDSFAPHQWEFLVSTDISIPPLSALRT